MPSDQERWNVPPESRRIAHPQKVYLKFPNSDKFVEEYLVDLSMTGMFVRCLSPAPPGTIFDFRMRLVSGGANVEGTAVVVWVRTEQQRLSHPKGMGVRFLELGEESLRQIRGTVERYAQDPESPGEMNNLRSVVEETLGEVLGPDIHDDTGSWRDMKRPKPPVAPPLEELPKPVEPPGATSASKLSSRPSTGPSPKPRPKSKPSVRPPPPMRPSSRERSAAPGPRRKAPRGLLLAGGVALVALLAVGFLLWDRLVLPGQQPAPQEPAPREASSLPSPSAAASETVVPASSPRQTEPSEPAGGEEPEEPEEPRIFLEEDLPERVRQWAAAWSRQDVDAYLDFYARDFAPVSGLSGPQWRRQRRDRLSGPEFINVEVEDLEVEALSQESGRTRFVQTYRSDTLSDTVVKTLVWKVEDGEWKIVSEESLG